ncbi:MAG: N-acetylmuramoyl-L-alanine amidase family protein [Bacteroidia bacterium]|jgi:N-acetylmuramoyl-L-alanine amidase
MRIFIASILCTLMFFLLPSAAKKRHIAGNELKTVVIDAGHGGKDPGCNGADEIWEKEVTLAIALKLGKFIEDSLPGVKVVYTRKTDKFLELWERPGLANKENADLFISIHCNSNTNTSAAGSETYFMGVHKTAGNLEVSKRENAAITYEENYQTNENYGGFDPNSPESHIIFTLVQNAFLQQSLKFSQLVEAKTTSVSKIKSRGVKQAGFLVLWQTAMPSVLVETGFLTNASDRAYLKTETGQKTIAKGIYRAVRDYKSDLDKAAAVKASKTSSDSTAKKEAVTKKK